MKRPGRVRPPRQGEWGPLAGEGDKRASTCCGRLSATLAARGTLPALYPQQEALIAFEIVFAQEHGPGTNNETEHTYDSVD